MLDEILNVGYWDLICFMWKLGVCFMAACAIPALIFGGISMLFSK